jgi:type I restriction enzyme S subunit
LTGGNITQSSARIRINPSKANKEYIKIFLRSNLAKRQYDEHRLGVAVPRLNLHHVRDLQIPLPPLAEQKRIAAILDAADALRTKRREALAQLDALLQSSFLTLFGDPVSHTQKLPIQPLESLLARPLQNGAYYPKETYTEVGGVEMVHMSDAFYEIVPRGKLKRVICPKADTEKYALTENDILIARRSLTLEGAAKPCLIPKSNEPLMFESSFIRVTPRPETITPLYLYHYLANDRVKQKSVRPYITQSTISGINQSNLEKVPVIVPPIALQRRFTGIVESVERQKAAQRAHLAELDALFAALQHRAFRGEL